MEPLLLQAAPSDENIDMDAAPPPPYSPDEPLLQPDLPSDGGAHDADVADGSNCHHLDLPADPPPYTPSEATAPPVYSNEGTVLPSTNTPDVVLPEVVISPPPYESDQPPPYSN